jgi:hypothetical protein
MRIHTLKEIFGHPYTARSTNMKSNIVVTLKTEPWRRRHSIFHDKEFVCVWMICTKKQNVFLFVVCYYYCMVTKHGTMELICFTETILSVNESQNMLARPSMGDTNRRKTLIRGTTGCNSILPLKKNAVSTERVLVDEGWSRGMSIRRQGTVSSRFPFLSLSGAGTLSSCLTPLL